MTAAATAEEDAEGRRQVFKNLHMVRIRWVDYMHGLFCSQPWYS
jgi:hypothetical protein